MKNNIKKMINQYKPYVAAGTFILGIVPLQAFSGNKADISISELPESSVTDFHCHIAGVGYGESGCFISKKMTDSYKFSFYLKSFGVREKEIKKHGDALIVKRLSQKIKESVLVGKAVVLAMDGIIKNGELDRENTEMFIPNEYVLKETGKYDNLLFGASINPYRKDALDRLKWAKKNGAVLIKWIPSIMGIDPSDDQIIPFYQMMKELDLPLLTHAGNERSFTGAHDKLCDPLKLELPLQFGVKVIAAHIATDGKKTGVDNFEKIIPLFEKYPDLYADISSLTQINKLGYLVKALKRKQLKGRLIYGTDWPLQFFPLVSPFFHKKYLSFKQIFQLLKIKNQWDRDILLKQALGTQKEIFIKGEDIIKETFKNQ